MNKRGKSTIIILEALIIKTKISVPTFLVKVNFMALILMFDFTRELALMAKAKVILVEVLVEVYGMVTSLKLPECFKH